MLGGHGRCHSEAAEEGIMQRLLWLVTAVIVVLAACGSTGSVVEVGSAPAHPDAESVAPATATTEAPSPAGATDAPATAPPGATAASRPNGEDELPGEPVDWPHASSAEAEVGVLGVEAGDVLHVRLRPGADQPIVDQLEPLRRGLTFTGSARRVGDAVWPEITFDGTTGWVNGRYVRLIAGTDDITAEILGDDPVLAAATMRALAKRVVDAYGLADGYHITWGPTSNPDLRAEEQRRIVISDGPRVGDLGEITLDVIDLFDDSVAAERLVIFAQPHGGRDFVLKAVERTFFCWRGGRDLCV